MLNVYPYKILVRKLMTRFESILAKEESLVTYPQMTPTFYPICLPDPLLN